MPNGIVDNTSEQATGALPNSSRAPEKNDDGKLNEVFDTLSQESNQDKASLDPSGSFLESIDPFLFTEREREYSDPEKHWVRKRWLAIAKDLAQTTQKNYGRGIRYLTLPGYYRLDVSLFLKAGLIDVIDHDEKGNPKTIYVAAFESEPTKYARMAGHTPNFTLFGKSQIEDALIDSKNLYYNELLKLFPFDIVNLDLTTSLTPQHEGPYSRTMQSIEEVFRRQSAYGLPWALFLTFRNMPDEWEKNTVEQLVGNLQHNLDVYPQALKAFMDVYNKISVVSKLHESQPRTCLSQAVMKWLVDRAHYYNLQLNSASSFFYERPSANYLIYKHILVFAQGQPLPGMVPTKGGPARPWIPDNLVKVITNHKPVDVVEKIIVTLLGRSSFEDELKNEIAELSSLVS